MWVANIDLQIGGWRVGVRTDHTSTRSRMLALLEPFLDTTDVPTRTNFSLRAPHGRFRVREGSLHVAGELVKSSTDLSVLVHALVGRLANVAALDREPMSTEDPEPFGDGRVLTRLRAFARERRVVLVDLHRPHLVGAELDDATELPVLEVVVDPASREVVVAPPLNALRWSAARLKPPQTLERYEIVGVIARPDENGAPDLRSIWLESTSYSMEWRSLLVSLAEQGAVEVVDHSDESATTAIRRLLGSTDS